MSTHHRKSNDGVLEFGAFKERQRRKCDGERGSDLREAVAAEFARHEAGDDDDRGLREHREQAQADHGKAEERQADVLDERSERRIGDKSPVEMARVAEELQLVAMKAVAAVGEEMKRARWRRAMARRMAVSAR